MVLYRRQIVRHMDSFVPIVVQDEKIPLKVWPFQWDILLSVSQCTHTVHKLFRLCVLFQQAKELHEQKIRLLILFDW